MSERIVDNPANHGWVEENGKWVWVAGGGSGTGGGIQDGDTEGQVTTWSGTAWTPDSSLTIDASGDATFSGTVSANVVALEGNAVSPLQIKGNVAGAVQIRMENTVNNLAMHVRINDAGAYEWVKNDYSAVVASIDQAGNINAAGFTVNGQPIGGGGLPDGGYTYGYNITAANFIATSDERVKDNISNAPVGLIDSLKGREWDWSESGEKGSGVVAQELEQVLPHLVHTDDEGMKSVAYNGLLAYLIEEVKALKAEVEALK